MPSWPTQKDTSHLIWIFWSNFPYPIYWKFRTPTTHKILVMKKSRQTENEIEEESSWIFFIHAAIMALRILDENAYERKTCFKPALICKNRMLYKIEGHPVKVPLELELSKDFKHFNPIQSSIRYWTMTQMNWAAHGYMWTFNSFIKKEWL